MNKIRLMRTQISRSRGLIISNIHFITYVGLSSENEVAKLSDNYDVEIQNFTEQLFVELLKKKTDSAVIMYKLMVRLIVIFLLISQSLAVLYCYNQPCPVGAEICDRDFILINATTAEVKIHCLDEHGDVLKTHVLYKSVKLVPLAEDNIVDEVQENGEEE